MNENQLQNMDDQQNIIIYRTSDGRASVALYAKDGKIWLNQQQMAELFATSKQAISYHIANILKDRELDENSVVKDYLTTKLTYLPRKGCTNGKRKCVK